MIDAKKTNDTVNLQVTKRKCNFDQKHFIILLDEQNSQINVVYIDHIL